MVSNWRNRFNRQQPVIPLIRPNLVQLAKPGADLPPFVADSALAQRYLTLLGALDWDHFPERSTNAPWSGPLPLGRAPVVAAFLIKLDQNLRYMSDVHTFLQREPALIWLLGFPLQPSSDFSCGFDPVGSLLHVRHFRLVLRTLPNAAFQFLLANTVHLIPSTSPRKNSQLVPVLVLLPYKSASFG